MRAYKKAFGIAAVAFFAALVGLTVPSNGAGPTVAPVLVLLAIVAAGFGIAGRFGSVRIRQWVESRF